MTDYSVNNICGTCDGTGSVGGIACHGCGGTGRLPAQVLADLQADITTILRKLNTIIDLISG